MKRPDNTRYYGGDGTIHRTGELDVEVHEGKVVAVWFRCAMLPFRQCDCDADRAASMNAAYSDNEKLSIVGIDFAK
jgi:hypothetical protein